MLAKALCELPYPRESKPENPEDEEEVAEKPQPIFRLFPAMFQTLLDSPLVCELAIFVFVLKIGPADDTSTDIRLY